MMKPCPRKWKQCATSRDTLEEEDVTTGYNVLKAYINSVSAQAGRHLTIE